jgi:hypothetical protein
MTVPITTNTSHILQHVHVAPCIVAKKHAFEVLGAFDRMVGLGHEEPIKSHTGWERVGDGADTVIILRVSVKFMLHFPG